MIHIEETSTGWRWSLIDYAGRVLVWGDCYTQREAFYAARDYRDTVWRLGAAVDTDQGNR